MRKPFTLVTASLAGLLLAGEADALTITNNDLVNQTVTVIEGDKASNLMLPPGESGEQLCLSGCIIRMKNGDEYDFEGFEVVVIEGEVLYLEEVPQGDASRKPDAGNTQ